MEKRELEEIIEAVRALTAPSPAFALHAPEHTVHHEFVQLLIEERTARKERMKRIQDWVAGSLLVSAILGAIVWIGHAGLEALRAAIAK